MASETQDVTSIYGIHCRLEAWPYYVGESWGGEGEIIVVISRYQYACGPMFNIWTSPTNERENMHLVASIFVMSTVEVIYK
jgi:hypothetical protein